MRRTVFPSNPAKQLMNSVSLCFDNNNDDSNNEPSSLGRTAPLDHPTCLCSHSYYCTTCNKDLTMTSSYSSTAYVITTAAVQDVRRCNPRDDKEKKEKRITTTIHTSTPRTCVRTSKNTNLIFMVYAIALPPVVPKHGTRKPSIINMCVCSRPPDGCADILYRYHGKAPRIKTPDLVLLPTARRRHQGPTTECTHINTNTHTQTQR